MRLRALAACATLAVQPASAAAQGSARIDPTKIEIVYKAQQKRPLDVSSNLTFRSGDVELKYDMYSPVGNKDKKPAIVFVSGAGEVRDWKWFQSYGLTAAALGFTGFVPDKRFSRDFAGTERATADTVAFIAHLVENSGRLGIDPLRICLWTFSAGGRLTALPYRAEGVGISCLVSYYGVMTVRDQVPPDTPRRESILSRYSADAAVKAPNARKIPTLVVRAGKDAPAINGAIDKFVDAAIAAEVPLTLVSYPAGEHGFDGLNDSEESRRIIGESFEFIESATRFGGSTTARPVRQDR